MIRFSRYSRGCALDVRDRLANALHAATTLTQAREHIIRLMGDLTATYSLTPTPEECMADTLRSVAPDFDAVDSEQAPSTDTESVRGWEYGGA